MTEPQKTTEAAAAEFSRPGPAAADLLAVVTSVPGVHAIEPGLGTALRTIDARVRRSSARTAHFGLHIDTAEGTALVEVCLSGDVSRALLTQVLPARSRHSMVRSRARAT